MVALTALARCQMVETSSGPSKMPPREQFVFCAGRPLISVDSRLKLSRENKHAHANPMNLMHLFLVLNPNLTQHNTTHGEGDVGRRGGSETYTSTLWSINLKDVLITLSKDL